MDLFTYLMAKNDHNTSVNKDLFSYLLGKNQSGTYTDYSGTSISANNTKKGKMQLSLKGNTSQTGTPTPSTPIPVNVVSGDNEVVVCGKNIIDNSLFTTGSATLVSYDSDNVVVKYTSPYLAKTQFIDVSTGKYTFSIGNISNATARVEIYKYKNGSVVGSVSLVNANGTLTIDNTDNSADQIRITLSNQNLSGTNEITFSHLQLEKSAIATSYEPYQSQTYPVNLPVENLLNVDNSEVGGIDASGVLVDGIQLWRTTEYIEVKPNTSYTLSTTNDDITIRLYEYNNSKTFISPRHEGHSKLTITTTANTKYLKWTVYSAGITLNKTIVESYKLQLERGSKANHYTPYGTTPIELCKIGTYQDYFTKNSGKNLVEGKIENGSIDGSGYIGSNSSFKMWYAKITQGETYTVSTDEGNLVAGFFYTQPSLYSTSYDNSRLVQANKTFTAPITGYIAFRSTANYTLAQCELGNSSTTYEPYGTGLWCKYNTIGKITLPSDAGGYNSGNNWYYISSNIVNGNIINTDMFCNKLAYKSNITDSSQTIGIGINPALTNFIIKNPNCTTQEQYRTFLATGVLLYYVLNTPYLSLIEDNNLIEQLDNLQNAMSYSGTTNINQVNDDLPFNIDAKIKVGN